MARPPGRLGPYVGVGPISPLSVIPAWFDRCMFDVADHLDELRSWPTERLVARHDDLVREQRRRATWKTWTSCVSSMSGVASTRRSVPTASRRGWCGRRWRRRGRWSRCRRSRRRRMPGALSVEQLGSVVKLADEDVGCGVGGAGAERGAGGSGSSGADAVDAVGGGRAARPGRGVCGCGGSSRPACCTSGVSCPT